MQHWQNTQLREKGSIDKEIGHVGALFRRYLEERYGADQVDNIFQEVLNRSAGQRRSRNIIQFIPFGLNLREETNNNPEDVD